MNLISLIFLIILFSNCEKLFSQNDTLFIKREPYIVYYKTKDSIHNRVVKAFYTDNNKLALKVNYKNGLRNGYTFFYNKNGKIIIKKKYKKGLLHGKSVEYIFGKNGIFGFGAKNIGHYRNGIKHGIFKHIRRGEINHKAIYENGIKIFDEGEIM